MKPDRVSETPRSVGEAASALTGGGVVVVLGVAPVEVALPVEAGAVVEGAVVLGGADVVGGAGGGVVSAVVVGDEAVVTGAGTSCVNGPADVELVADTSAVAPAAGGVSSAFAALIGASEISPSVMAAVIPPQRFGAPSVALECLPRGRYCSLLIKSPESL
jgi:hypothetical protein